MGKWKFEFYGWFIVLSFIFSGMLAYINMNIPFLGWFIALFAYSKLFKKELDANLFINALATGVITFIIFMVLAAIVGVAFFALIGGQQIQSALF